MMKLPFDGSPSARSIALCDHRSTSLNSARASFARIAMGDSPTVKVGSLTDSMSAMTSDASCDASRVRP